MLSLVADSITTGGDRLATVVANHEAQLPRCGPVAVTVTATGHTVATGHPEQLGAVFGAARIGVLCGWPRLVDDDDMHAPFVNPHERATHDLSFCGVLSCARAADGGRRGATLAVEAARYLWLLAGADVTAMHHAALPVTHHAFTSAGEPAGRFTGWLTWAELIVGRGGMS